MDIAHRPEDRTLKVKSTQTAGISVSCLKYFCWIVASEEDKKEMVTVAGKLRTIMYKYVYVSRDLIVTYRITIVPKYCQNRICDTVVC